MSYYIEDDLKVIRTSRGFVFMCLGGDNNVTESKWVGGKKQWAEVRARSWCHMNHQILEATETEIMAFCQRVYTGDPEYEVFKKGGKWVCCKDMSNYFRNGMRRAQSLETLLLVNRGQILEGFVIVYPDKQSTSRSTELQAFLRTTQDLEAWLDEAKMLREKHIANGKDCYISLAFSGKEPLRYGAGEKTCEVVIKSTSRKSNSYVCSFIYNRQISFTDDLSKALVFDSEEDAWAAIGRIWRDIKVVSLASQDRTQHKNYLLLFCDGTLSGTYVQKTSRNSVHGTFEPKLAMRFSGEKDAMRYIQRLREKGFGHSKCAKYSLVNISNNSVIALSMV